ncbi:hypothetical protein LTR56_002395 [Elasticomyces elasticus]|nr:hypothetical protein LTR56_002395 [Elasticomyces elasticus]KAK3665959.1 hypothetical protein LTR22_003278 [Elasticomyces elasticus]KAK4929431.1 hypothetical protein LTR49_004035 [Elasticomyces elasticus]KAK5764720.1 hypothetical protein LTS12_005221 [Elasticomyces elasticus]
MDLVPGTEIMTEAIDHTRFIHAHNYSDDVVLVPQPSADEHDPLNWSKMWKTTVIVNQGLFVLLSVFTALSIAPLTPIYMVEWDRSLSEVALLSGAVVISLGYANLVIIPCSNFFGRRPVLLACCAITLATDVWQALATSYESFLAARVLSGIGTAANESLMILVVTDIYFLNERGRFAGLYL